MQRIQKCQTSLPGSLPMQQNLPLPHHFGWTFQHWFCGGMQDPVCLPGLLDNLHDYAPNATVVRIEDAGHYPMQSHSMLVNRAIRDFLRRTPR